MTLRKLTKTDRAQAETLWREIFEDESAFTSYYFDERFHPEHSFGAFDRDHLVAMAQGRPTEILIGEKTYAAMLVAGVSTKPAYRKQGFMHRLMLLLIDHAKSCGFSCCYLHPVSESLYTSLGFRNGTDARIVCSDGTRKHKPFVLTDRFIGKDLLSVYRTVQKTHDGMQLRDEPELMSVFRDYATEAAKTLIAYDENRPVGYIFYSDAGSVFELTALSPDAYAFLLDEASIRSGCELTAAAPTDCGLPGEVRYSMQYLVFDDAFRLPLRNGYCCLAY